MTRAFDDTLLHKSQITLARMLDTAVNGYGYSLEEFYALFLNSDISARYAKGDCAIVAGRSGNELAFYVINEVEPDLEVVPQPGGVDRTAEFWTGWALAYYQWYSGENFARINEYAPIEKIHKMYKIYHEMDVTAFVEAMVDMRSEYFKTSALKRLRTYAGISQKELAEKAGVPLRTIQQYEQHQKDIKHARVDVVINLSKALHCSIEDVLD